MHVKAEKSFVASMSVIKSEHKYIAIYRFRRYIFLAKIVFLATLKIII